MKKIVTAWAKMVAVFGIMAVSSWALYMDNLCEYCRCFAFDGKVIKD